MPVEVEGDANRRVAHLRLEVLGVRTGGHHERGVGVPEVVEANRTDSASSDGRREDPVAEVVVVEDVPAWGREHESELVRRARDELQDVLEEGSMPRPTVQFKRRAWLAFQRAIDPLARPKPLPPQQR